MICALLTSVNRMSFLLICKESVLHAQHQTRRQLVLVFLLFRGLDGGFGFLPLQFKKPKKQTKRKIFFTSFFFFVEVGII